MKNQNQVLEGMEDVNPQTSTPEQEEAAIALNNEAENAVASDEDIEKPVAESKQLGYDINITIPHSSRKIAEKHIKSLDKFATKLGIEPPQVTVGETYVKRVQDPFVTIPPYRFYGVDVFDVTIKIDGTFKLPGNYKMVAFVDNTTGGSFEIGDTKVPAEYLEISGDCDYCQQERYRGKNFIIQDGDSGEFMRLGSSCVKKFIGMDPSKHLRAIRFIERFNLEMGGMMEDFEFRGEGQPRGLSPKHTIVEVADVISIVRSVLKKDGGLIKREWEEIERGYGRWETIRTNQGDATADKAEKMLYEEVDFPLNKSYVNEFTRFASKLMPLEPNMVKDPYSDVEYDKNTGFNEYRAKVRDTVNEDRNLRIYETAFLVSAINYYENEKKRIAKNAELADSTWLGNVGEKIGVSHARLDNVNTGEGQFGTWYMWSFVDESGNSLKKFGTLGEKFRIKEGKGKDLQGYQEGDVFAFTAVVKKHDDYKGLKSTMLGRLSKFK